MAKPEDEIRLDRDDVLAMLQAMVEHDFGARNEQNIFEVQCTHCQAWHAFDILASLYEDRDDVEDAVDKVLEEHKKTH